ncbi:hypothetical protein NQ176_g8705 [Zarea fungicola]|uniref:Uncharacterized protein n=1 Tax=Zarea fungicola TaxID=93591 RepID=A0ACC1MRB8_9HYPO|nr:hypothetical protein NQ176_g8705 [Lecanicillium fungicola]
MGRSLLDRIQAKLEFFRLEQHYTRRRHRRSTFVSNAVYVDGDDVGKVLRPGRIWIDDFERIVHSTVGNALDVSRIVLIVCQDGFYGRWSGRDIMRCGHGFTQLFLKKERIL